MTITGKRPVLLIILAVFAAVFGVMTLKSGGTVLFVDGPARAAAGNYVPFVLWFNFLAGFAYILAAVGLFLMRPWALVLAISIAALTIAAFAALGIYIWLGGAYETRTIAAMSLRSFVWLGIAFYYHRLMKA